MFDSVVTTLPKWLELLDPDLFQQREIIAEIEVGLVTELHLLQHFKDKRVRAIAVPIVLERHITVAADRKAETMTVQRAVKVQRTS